MRRWYNAKPIGIFQANGEPRLPRVKYSSLGRRRNPSPLLLDGIGDGKSAYRGAGDTRFQRKPRSIDFFPFSFFFSFPACLD